MDKIKDKLHKDKGIEISKVYIHSKYEENVFLMAIVRVLVIFMGTYGAVQSFISGYRIECDTDLITMVCGIGAVLFGGLYGFKKASKWIFVGSLGLFVLMAFLVGLQCYAFFIELWNECVKYLASKNINVPELYGANLLPYDKSFMWGLICMIISTCVGFFTFCKAHFIPVFLITFVPLELVLCYGLVPDLSTVVCFFCCNAVALALWLHKFKSRHYSNLNLHLKGTAVISLILCAFFVVALCLSNFMLIATNYQRPEKFDELRQGIYMHEAVDAPAIKDKTKNLDHVGNREFDFREHLVVELPYNDGTVYIKGSTGSYFFADSWYDYDDSVYEEYPVNEMMQGNVSIADVFVTSEKGKRDLAFMNLKPTISLGSAFLPYGFFNDGELTVDYDRGAFVRQGDWSYTVSYDTRVNNLWAELCADPSYTRKGQSGEYSGLANGYNSFAKEYYTQYPDDLTKLKETTDSIYGKVSNRQDIINAVKAVKTYLHENTKYELKPGKTPVEKNFAEYFLFENKQGYCVHYATTATLMFRMMGIPARFAEGYVVTELDFENCDDMGVQKEKVTYLEDYKAVETEISVNNYTVSLTDASAHAWVEIYVEGLGWLPVEMTPGYNQSTTALGNLEENTQPSTEPTTIPPAKTNTAPTTPKQEETVAEEKPISVSGIILLTVLIIVVALLLSAVVIRSVAVKVRLKSFKSKENNKNVERLYFYLEKILLHAGVKDLQKENLTDGFDKLFKRYDFVDEETEKSVVVILQKLFYGKKQISDQEVVVVEKFVLSFVKKFMELQSPAKRFLYKYLYFLV